MFTEGPPLVANQGPPLRPCVLPSRPPGRLQPTAWQEALMSDLILGQALIGLCRLIAERLLLQGRAALLAVDGTESSGCVYPFEAGGFCRTIDVEQPMLLFLLKVAALPAGALAQP